MKKSLIFVALLLALCALFICIKSCPPPPPPVSTFPNYVTDSLHQFGVDYTLDSVGWPYMTSEIVVEFVDGTSPSEKEGLRNALGMQQARKCPCTDIELWELSDNPNDSIGTGVNEVIASMGDSSIVQEVDYNKVNYTVLDGHQKFDLKSIKINDTPVKDSRGMTRIAILDTGFDPRQRSFTKWTNKKTKSQQRFACSEISNDWYGWNFVADNNNPTDDHGHGSHVAGIIQENILSMSSIGSGDCQIRLIPYKTHDANGVSTLYNVTCAVYRAIVDSASVINASWGFYGNPSPILESAIEEAGRNNMLFVASSGNDHVNLGDTLMFPVGFSSNNIIGVGAFDTLQLGDGYVLTNAEEFSNYGNDHVDILARGINISSLSHEDSHNPVFKTGTSMAAPVVSALAASLYCCDQLNAYQIKNRILDNAIRNNSSLSNKILNGNIVNVSTDCQ